jgi:hypothetical protein
MWLTKIKMDLWSRERHKETGLYKLAGDAHETVLATFA